MEAIFHSTTASRIIKSQNKIVRTVEFTSYLTLKGCFRLPIVPASTEEACSILPPRNLDAPPKALYSTKIERGKLKLRQNPPRSEYRTACLRERKNQRPEACPAPKQCGHRHSITGQEERFASRNAPRQKHFLQFARLAMPARPIGIPWPPVPKSKSSGEQIGVKSVVPVSVALRGRPVNHFQEEACAEFRNGDAGGAGGGDAHGVMIRRGDGIGCRGAARRARSGTGRENKFVKISLDQNAPGQIDSLAAGSLHRSWMTCSTCFAVRLR